MSFNRSPLTLSSNLPEYLYKIKFNREKDFINEEDKKKYLSLLKEYSGKWDTYILAYCLMSNHVHLLTKPTKNESLYKMMQGITLCYTQYLNWTYKRTGRLWENRYHLCVVDKEIINLFLRSVFLMPLLQILRIPMCTDAHRLRRERSVEWLSVSGEYRGHIPISLTKMQLFYRIPSCPG